MVDPRRQFRVLYRDFLSRLIDLELLSSQGDPRKLFGQCAALLAAFNLVVAIFSARPLARIPADQLSTAVIGHAQFLIDTTMAVAGMLGVMAWGAAFPDRRDSLVLGILPVRARTILFAKAAAVATGLGVCLAAINIFTGISYPVVLGDSILGTFRWFAAYWITMAAAGSFLFFSLLALQGIAACILPHRLFLRASNFLQLAAFFAVLGGYFLTPGPSELQITAAGNRAFLDWFPSFWFLGLFQDLNGADHPVFQPLAKRAWWAWSMTAGLTFVTYSLAYRRFQRTIEQPDITPSSRRRPAARFIQAIVSKLIPKPVERAVFLFAARILIRSRQHRVILSVYCGIGFAISLAYARGLVYGETSLYRSLRHHISVPRWNELNVPLMIAGFVTLFFAIIGARAVFALPATLKANWVFRVTAVHSPRAYFAAIRKALYGLTALPVWIACTAAYLAIWRPAHATAHLAILLAAGIILIERSMFEFRKIPFTCSYLPGKADLTRKLGAYGAGFLFLTDIGTRIEYSAIQTRARYFFLLAILAVVAVRSRKRWTAFATRPKERLQFQEFEAADVAPLDLRRDGAWGEERYIDAVDPLTEQPLRRRIFLALAKGAAAALILAIIGAAYEEFVWSRERGHAVRTGWPIDIGGRSLNLYCLGGPGPTVVFESGGGGVGSGWLDVQREVSKFAGSCWYDRAGQGWSDPAPFPRDSVASAKDLHALLRVAKVEPPYILVGASLGGLIVRVYNGMYPRDMAGMILVDSTHFDERDSIPPAGDWNLAALYPYETSLLARFLLRTGTLRFFSEDVEPRGLAEFSKVPILESARQARAARPMVDRPLIVLTAGLPPRKGANPVEARQYLARQKQWIEVQKQLLRFSNRSRQVVVKNSRHCIQCDDPKAIVDAIREVAAAFPAKIG